MTLFLKGIAIWSVVTTLVYFGAYYDNDGLSNVSMFTLWLFYVAVLVALLFNISQDNKKDKVFKKGGSISKILFRLWSILILIALIYKGFFFITLLIIVTKIFMIIETERRKLNNSNKKDK